MRGAAGTSRYHTEAMALAIDTFELTRTGGSLSGESAVAGLSRLASLLAAPDGRIEWRLRGWRDPRPEGGFDDFMELGFDATVQAGCVRCLQPVTTVLRVTRPYRLVRSEDEAQRLDPDDDEFDVIVGSARFDLGALIEDEAIMALPPASRHDACEPTVPGGVPDAPEVDEPNPFAALERLRGNRRTNGGEGGG